MVVWVWAVAKEARDARHLVLLLARDLVLLLAILGSERTYFIVARQQFVAMVEATIDIAPSHDVAVTAQMSPALVTLGLPVCCCWVPVASTEVTSARLFIWRRWTRA